MLFTLDKLICRFVKQFQALLADDLAQVICTPLHMLHSSVFSSLLGGRTCLALALGKTSTFALKGTPIAGYGFGDVAFVCLEA